jgi:hypothetical protein
MVASTCIHVPPGTIKVSARTQPQKPFQVQLSGWFCPVALMQAPCPLNQILCHPLCRYQKAAYFKATQTLTFVRRSSASDCRLVMSAGDTVSHTDTDYL